MQTASADDRDPGSAHSRRRLRLRYLVVLGCLLVMALVGLAAYDLAAARDRLVRGSDELHAARALVSPLARFEEPAVRARLREHLAAANREFGDARAHLGLWRPMLGHLGWVPGVGEQLSAAPDATDAAFYTTRAALSLMDGLAPVWVLVSAPGAGGSLVPRLLPLVSRARPRFAAARADVDRASSAAAQLPVHTGNRSLDSAAARLREALPPLRVGLRWLVVTPQMLGAGGPSSFLLLLQDPAELRATGG